MGGRGRKRERAEEGDEETKNGNDEWVGAKGTGEGS